MLHACGVCRQQGCEEAEDVLRPYSCLAYAWDEPALPHRLLLALPGNRLLGAFDLDKAIPLPRMARPPDKPKVAACLLPACMHAPHASQREMF